MINIDRQFIQDWNKTFNRDKTRIILSETVEISNKTREVLGECMNKCGDEPPNLHPLFTFGDDNTPVVIVGSFRIS